MITCKCYHADKNFLGEIGVCWGTKECEPCSCGGDEAKCDFYDYVREKVKKPITNADKYFRNATDEKLAAWFSERPRNCPPPYAKDGFVKGRCRMGCGNCWLDWLKQEVERDG